MKPSNQKHRRVFDILQNQQKNRKFTTAYVDSIPLFLVGIYALVCLISGTVVGLGLFGAAPASAATGINQEMSFEGKVVNSNGTNITDGTYNMEFKMYSGCTNEPTNNTGCTLVWTEDYLVSHSDGVPFTSGTYAVNLGQYCPFSGGTCNPSAANDGNTNSGVNWNSYPLYLSLQVGNTSSCNPSGNNFQTSCGGDGEMSPYVLLTSTPYAMNANAVGGFTASQLGQLAANQTWTGTNLLQSNGATGLQVQDSSNSANVLTVDTLGDVVDVGSNTSLVHPAQLSVKNTNSANRALILQGAASQSVDILDIYNSAGSFVSGYDVNGNEYLNGLLQTGTTSNAGDVQLKDGTANNYSVSVVSQALTNSYTITLPTAGATGSQCVQSTSGSTSTSTALQWGSCGSGGGGTNSPISEVSLANIADSSSAGVTSVTASFTTTNVGDVVMLYSAECSTSSYVSSISNYTGTAVWSKVIGSTSISAPNSPVEIWMAQVTSAGSQSLKVNYGATTSCGYDVDVQEFTATGVSSNTAWSIVNAGNNIYTTGTTKTVTFPTLTTNTLSNEAYIGFAYADQGSTATTCSSGTGFTCADDVYPAVGNPLAWNTSLSANTSYTPTSLQTANGTTNAVGLILVAYGGLSTSYINNSTTLQSGNMNVQAATSGSVAATFEANAAGSADILDLKNGSGTNVATFGSSGATLFENSTDSTAAFQVANHSGSALLTADTSNSAIVLGADGTPGNVTVRGGVATGTNTAGSNLTFQASNGTGSGGSGSFAFQTAGPSTAPPAAIGLDNKFAKSFTTAASSFTSNPFTVGTQGNMLLVAQVITGCAYTISNVKFAGTTMTTLATGIPASNTVSEGVYYLVGASVPTGSNTLTYSLSGSSCVSGYSLTTYYNVNTASPFGTEHTNMSGGVVTTATNTVAATSSTQLVYDALGDDSLTATAPTTSAPQTVVESTPGSSNQYGFASSTQPGLSGNANFSWTVPSSNIVDIGVPINRETSGPATTSDSLSTVMTVANTGAVNLLNNTDSTAAFRVQNASNVSLFTVDTSALHINIGAGATGETTPTLLILDNETGSSIDPTGANGAMYYNVTTESFRCYENGVWLSCLGGLRSANSDQSSLPAGDTVANKTADTNFADNYSIPANDCVKGRVYRVTATGTYSAIATQPAIDFNLKLGSTVIATTNPGGTHTDTNSSTGTYTWQINTTITCAAAPSASSLIEADGLFSASPAGGNWLFGPMANSAASVATNGALTLQLSAKWTGGSAPSASDTVTMRQFIVEALGP